MFKHVKYIVSYLKVLFVGVFIIYGLRFFLGGGEEDKKCYNELINVIFFTSLLAQA